MNGDGDRLMQVFVNMLHNAAKFAGREGQIWLEAKRENKMAVVTIRDNGCGISANALSKIFEPLWQAGRTRDLSHDGLGIGLFLVKQLVELHGGRVEACSDGPNKGAKFTVALPIIPKPEPAEMDSSLHHT